MPSIQLTGYANSLLVVPAVCHACINLLAFCVVIVHDAECICKKDSTVYLYPDFETCFLTREVTVAGAALQASGFN